MIIASTVLAILYLAVRYRFKHAINYMNSTEEISLIFLGTLTLTISSIGYWLIETPPNLWVGLAIIAALLIQLPLMMKINKIKAIIITVLLIILVCIPKVQIFGLALVSVYFIFLGFKTHKMTFVTSAVAAGIAPISILVKNYEIVYYGMTLYLFTVHYVHTKSLLEMMQNAGKNVITDQLTGLYNRRWLYAKAKQLCEEQEVGVIFCDIDNFKKLNDTKGHEYGDYVLKQVGKIMNREFKGYGYAARYGGEELVALITTPSKSVKLAEKMLEAIRKEVNVTMSIGVAIGSGDPEKIIKIADERMYISKNSGKNRVTFETVEPKLGQQEQTQVV